MHFIISDLTLKSPVYVFITNLNLGIIHYTILKSHVLLTVGSWKCYMLTRVFSLFPTPLYCEVNLVYVRQTIKQRGALPRLSTNTILMYCYTVYVFYGHSPTAKGQQQYISYITNMNHLTVQVIAKTVLNRIDFPIKALCFQEKRLYWPVVSILTTNTIIC